MWRYREFLPLPEGVKRISLHEGFTPLIKAESRNNLYVKFEGSNPTGSFKDRGVSLTISIAKSLGVNGVLAASTGNTASSTATYAARAGIKCILILPSGGVAKGKLFQSILHGASIIEIEGSFDKAIETVLSYIGYSRNLYPLNSFNPWRLEGQKTIAYEIVETLGYIPSYVIVPVGNAGNISAIWKGFKELYDHGLICDLPRMIGVQAKDAAPIANAWIKGLDKPLFVSNPKTIASAIRIGKPINWVKAWKAVKESNGTFITVDDNEILNAQIELARLSGIPVEPAGASSYAGYLKLLDQNVIDEKDTVVLIATGHALKDPNVTVNVQFYFKTSNIHETLKILDNMVKR